VSSRKGTKKREEAELVGPLMNFMDLNRTRVEKKILLLELTKKFEVQQDRG
jgi:hypothetical protein